MGGKNNAEAKREFNRRFAQPAADDTGHLGKR
jgi:hypothetical protein